MIHIHMLDHQSLDLFPLQALDIGPIPLRQEVNEVIYMLEEGRLTKAKLTPRDVQSRSFLKSGCSLVTPRELRTEFVIFLMAYQKHSD